MNSMSGIAGTLDLGRVNQMSINLIKNKDTNGDKVLTADEAGNFGAVFSKIDVNSNGQINKDELNAFYFSPAPVDQMTKGLISSKDKDGDGALNIDELGLPQDIFTKIDANDDGQANKDELNAAYFTRQIHQDINRLIMTKDKDGDNALSIDELGVSQDIFTKIDANGDGTLSRDELDAAHLNWYNNAMEALKSYSSENIGSKVDITS